MGDVEVEVVLLGHTVCYLLAADKLRFHDEPHMLFLVGLARLDSALREPGERVVQDSQQLLDDNGYLGQRHGGRVGRCMRGEGERKGHDLRMFDKICFGHFSRLHCE